MTEADKTHILVIDDDTRLRKLLHQYLSENGFMAASPAEARVLMTAFLFDILILDVMMPGENGYAFAKSLREKGNNIPILMLTAMGELQDRITGLESGVDDYLSKPFDPKELLLRINSILRRTLITPVKEKQTLYKFGTCQYDLQRSELTKNGQFVSLTAADHELLKVLIQKIGQEVTREELARTLQTDNERTVDVQVNRLRKKIETDPKNPRYLQTVRGKGYLLLPD